MKTAVKPAHVKKGAPVVRYTPCVTASASDAEHLLGPRHLGVGTPVPQPTTKRVAAPVAPQPKKLGSTKESPGPSLGNLSALRGYERRQILGSLRLVSFQTLKLVGTMILISVALATHRWIAGLPGLAILISTFWVGWKTWGSAREKMAEWKDEYRESGIRADFFGSRRWILFQIFLCLSPAFMAGNAWLAVMAIRHLLKI